MARPDLRSRVEDCYHRVADSLIDRGTAPWTEARKPGQKALPHNIKFGQPCRGGNSVWLASTASRRLYTDERWGTYKQIKDAGEQLWRGDKRCAILFWQFETR